MFVIIETQAKTHINYACLGMQRGIAIIVSYIYIAQN